jgi:hypothetical protein
MDGANGEKQREIPERYLTLGAKHTGKKEKISKKWKRRGFQWPFAE